MMFLQANFTTRTFAGLSRCTAEKNIYGNARDIEKVEDAIKWVKKVFTAGSDPDVTFTTWKDGYHKDISRIFRDYKNGKQGFTVVRWTDGEPVTEFHEKLTTKLIRECYLECADKAIEWEEAA